MLNITWKENRQKTRQTYRHEISCYNGRQKFDFQRSRDVQTYWSQRKSSGYCNLT